MTTLERLKKFHLYLKENGYGGRNVFEREIGVSEGYLSQSKRKGVNSDVLEKIAENFNELNINWLITGRGSMLVNTDENSDEKDCIILKLSNELQDALQEIGRLNMELKSVKEHNFKQKRG